MVVRDVPSTEGPFFVRPVIVTEEIIRQNYHDNDNNAVRAGQ